MRQIQVSHVPGRFSACRQRGHQPRHIEHHGRSLQETMQKDVPAIRHSLECACGRSTGMHSSLQAAESDWGVLFGQVPMALSAPIPFPTTARRRNASPKEKSRG